MRTLGLDLGTNSIGWALIDENQPDSTGSIVDSGVRIFHEAVEKAAENKNRTPKNKARRDARLARRVLQRRARRRHALRNQLVAAGFLPRELSAAPDPERLLNDLGDVYDLRKKALDEPLESHEVGRVLLHLCARRGFMSNRKIRWGDLRDDPDAREFIDEIERAEQEKSDGEKSEDKDESKVLAEIAELWRTLNSGEARTLGEYLAGLPRGERRRARHTAREMYRDEFNSVWIAQAEYHPGLTDDLKADLHKIIFHQRPIKLKGGRIGMCSLETNRPRAAMARLEAQRFRFLQDVNHLEIINRQIGRGEKLAQDQRDDLAAALETQQSMTWGAIRKRLGISSRTKFNLEEGSKAKGLTGNTTTARIRGIIQEWWDVADAATQIALTEDLLTIGKKSVLMKRLRGHNPNGKKSPWSFDAQTAFKLATLEFEDGHANLSLKAIKRLLPHMEQGSIYSDARKAAGYGYERDATPRERELLGPPPADLRNPVVEKALHEVRKVVNAVIAKHGKPDLIRVEMARDLKMSRKDKARKNKQDSENRRMNELADKEFVKAYPGRKPSHEDRIKYRLWRESDCRCPYTGKVINIHELFSPYGVVDIEHIIPYGRSMDDSFRNKTICMAEENRLRKRNRTPLEAYGHTDGWDEMLQRVPERKRRWFQQDDKAVQKLLENFESRQLNDTRYISREAKKYLTTLGCDVDVTRGGMTGALRHAWGLNHILAGDNPTEDEVAEKNRADNRHHALDAIVVAVTTPSLYQRMVRSARDIDQVKQQASLVNSAKEHKPWEGFEHDVERALLGIAVSHASLRKIHGALHEASGYGRRYVPGIGEERFVYRVPLPDLTPAMVKKIVDPVLRKSIEERITLVNGLTESKDIKKEHIQKSLGDSENPFYHPRNPNGQPVRRVRIHENLSPDTLYPHEKQRDKRGGAFKYEKLGSNHHVEIFRDNDSGKTEARFVSMLEAANRVRRKNKPMIDREWEGHEFLMSLSIDEMVEIGDGGIENLYRVQMLDASNGNLTLRHHRAATLKDDTERIFAVPSRFIAERRGRKVIVNPIGEVRPAHD